ncbi:MAG TPA: GNAT family N-acetyltransferase [Clostridiaceae bacterium]|nr:GNAT family N-acetyltransferase [Clostridiaceae bacterium]
MLDKSLPFFRVIMVRKAGTPVPEPLLPDGYKFVTFIEGDERHWAEIETSVGEFNNVYEAVNYYRENYLPYTEEVKRRTIFIQNKEGEKIATLTNWWGYTGERRDPWMHWVAVKPEYQGLGMGKAIVFEGVRRMILIEGDRDFYLPTQTWSYKAIGVYLKAGFEFCKEKYAGGFENEYEKALQVIKDKIR